MDGFEKLLTEYGPLGLGWVFALYLLRVNTAMQDKIMAAFLADTQAKGSLEATLDRLIAAVDKR